MIKISKERKEHGMAITIDADQHEDVDDLIAALKTHNYGNLQDSVRIELFLHE